MRTRKTIFRETTEVPVRRSVEGIVDMLAQAGAKTVNQQYEEGRPIGVQFTLLVQGVLCTFALPTRTAAIVKELAKRNASGRGRRKAPSEIQAQADKIAWRQLFAWVEAQLAMIDSGMAAPGEVFLPYLLNAAGVTMWDAFTHKQLAPPEGN